MSSCRGVWASQRITQVRWELGKSPVQPPAQAGPPLGSDQAPQGFLRSGGENPQAQSLHNLTGQPAPLPACPHVFFHVLTPVFPSPGWASPVPSHFSHPHMPQPLTILVVLHWTTSADPCTSCTAGGQNCMQYSVCSLVSARTRGIIPSLHLLAVPLSVQPIAVRFERCKVFTGYSSWKCWVVLALGTRSELGTLCSGWVTQPLTKAGTGYAGSLQSQRATEGVFGRWPGSYVLCQATAHIMGKYRPRGHLTSETPRSQRRFSQGKACLLHVGCANACNFPKCQELDFIFCDNGKLCSCSPLWERRKTPSNDSCLIREARLLADM